MPATWAAEQAKNVILFLGDGTGIPTLSAASIYGYGRAQALYVERMPHIGLSDTSSSIAWVTDSAAGMTSIVTGEKNPNTVLSQSAEAQPGVRDGKPLKTILEYAEERGLATGVVSNSPMVDATPAACYAHVNSRSNYGEIFAQALHPRFGDGVDVILGPGRTVILKAMRERGTDLYTELPRKGYRFVESAAALDRVGADARRVVALFDTDDFDLGAAADHAIRILSRNPKGFFLMVESNNHFADARKCLERTVAFDKIIARTGERMKADTLILFTADHSYDLRVIGGRKGGDFLPAVRVNDSHTGEEVLVGAEGPGSERVHGMFPNTYLFDVMLRAYGWNK